MNISLRWLNQYLDPGDVTAELAEDILTHTGFPVEGIVTRDTGDLCLDVEVTSNRGDMLSHVGCAREIAAKTGRTLNIQHPTDAVVRAAEDAPGEVSEILKLENRVSNIIGPDSTPACAAFTARVIRNVEVGPSPAWLCELLEAVGQRPINNVVDVTNWLQFAFGQPSHVFDLNTFAKDSQGLVRVGVDRAQQGEKLALLDGRTVTLRGDELVVIDDAADGGPRAVSLAGVMGGADTQVTEKTTDVLFEAATWDPVLVRTAARRFDCRTDASYRFERIVDPRTIEHAARCGIDLLLQVAGGELVHGVLREGAPDPTPTRVRLRTSRVADVLGVEVPHAEIVRILRGLEIGVEESGEGTLVCTPPAFRPDLTREIDQIEEVARIHGLDELPIHEKIAVRVAPPQVSERAKRTLAQTLTACGFYETVTFSFVSPEDARNFLPPNAEPIMLTDERRKADPMLRPSVLPSLLQCRKANQDAGVHREGGVRLFETSAVFHQQDGKGVERAMLSLLADAPETPGGKADERHQAGVRLVRGAIEAAVRALGGPPPEGARITIEPRHDGVGVEGYDNAARAHVSVQLGEQPGQRVGVMGLVDKETRSRFDLDTPVVAAELELGPILALFPPKASAHALPEFPAIERDLSLIVEERTPWRDIDQLVSDSGVDLLDGHAFVGTYRGKQVPDGKKSVTLRLRFRHPGRTLRHDEVDPQVESIVSLAKDKLGARLRA